MGGVVFGKRFVNPVKNPVSSQWNWKPKLRCNSFFLQNVLLGVQVRKNPIRSFENVFLGYETVSMISGNVEKNSL